jgi:hypothetical protein
MSSNVPPHLPPQFKMQRASTQLSISHNHHNQQLQMRSNLNKNFGSSHDIKIPEVRTLEKKGGVDKSKDLLKKSRAPAPPATSNGNNSRMKVRFLNSNVINFKLISPQFFSHRHQHRQWSLQKRKASQ